MRQRFVAGRVADCRFVPFAVATHHYRQFCALKQNEMNEKWHRNWRLLKVSISTEKTRMTSTTGDEKRTKIKKKKTLSNQARMNRQMLKLAIKFHFENV